MKRQEVTPEEAIAYRIALAVTQIFSTSDGEYFPICPRCQKTLEREYQAYCDRCGQKLSWRRFSRAKVVKALGNQ